MNGINVRPWGDEWLWSVGGENNTKHLGEGRATTEAEAWMQVCKFLGDGAALAVRALRAERDAAVAERDRLRAVIAEAAEGLRNRPGGAFWSPARAEAVAVRQAQPRADRWRLISDTTPRDGSRLLLWYPPIRIEDGVAAEGFWSSQYAGDWMPSRGSAALGRHERRPTHWMPLPQGPALGGGR